MAQPNLVPKIGLWDLNYVFFSSYENALLTFMVGKGRFMSYLLSVLSHEIVAYCRKEGTFRESPLRMDDGWDEEDILSLHDVVQSDEPDPSEVYEREEALERLAACLDDLTEDETIVASLRLEGFTFEEISKRTKITLKRVRLRYASYLKKVRKSQAK